MSIKENRCARILIQPGEAQAACMQVMTTRDFDHKSVPAGFVNRAQRVNLKFPVVFDHDTGKTTGHTVDISESGLLVDFDEVMDVWTTGDLSIVGKGWHLQIKVRVARVHGQQAAFAFRNMDPHDLVIIRNLIATRST
jgi:hypothetical protein